MLPAPPELPANAQPSAGEKERANSWVTDAGVAYLPAIALSAWVQALNTRWAASVAEVAVRNPLTSAFHVSWPTMPSTTRPMAPWKARTTASVLGPKAPSTTSRLAMRELAWLCTARTARPLAPDATWMTSAGQVWLPTMPSAARPWPDWNCWVAPVVSGPKIPSTLSEAPCALSRYCTVRTFSPVAGDFTIGQFATVCTSPFAGAPSPLHHGEKSAGTAPS